MSPATDAAELESSDSLNELGLAGVTVGPDVDATGIGIESWGGKGNGGAVPLWRASEGIDLRDCSEGGAGCVAVGVTCACREAERPRGVVDISKFGSDAFGKSFDITFKIDNNNNSHGDRQTCYQALDSSQFHEHTRPCRLRPRPRTCAPAPRTPLCFKP
jgi:hypothetical protein